MKAPSWAKHIKPGDTLLIKISPSHLWYWREDLRGEIELKVRDAESYGISGYIDVPEYGEACCNVFWSDPENSARIIKKVKHTSQINQRSNLTHESCSQ